MMVGIRGLMKREKIEGILVDRTELKVQVIELVSRLWYLS